MVRRKFVGKFRRNTDDCTANRNVVGSSSVYSDEFSTTITVTFFIGMSSKCRRKIPTTHVSSEFRRKWPTEFRRLQIFGFRQKLVGEEEILVQVSFGTAITERSSATVYELADGNEEDVVGTKKSS
ncbi:hypothetical protein F2Q68_00005329 [Brassica cretica]|uniref:Uncharacterized protein n=1 Tax=Brassica cretica TaxID=69181 RepID=A0A8S9JQ17_BRACR|nr:hypothetical protein F2Q68_00005329 [Brassica cretica]